MKRPAVAWLPLSLVAGVDLALLMLANGPLSYGLMTDELYYIDCTKHLAWGYVDHPPLSIGLLWLSMATLGSSTLAIRAFSMLASVATPVLAGLIARELGGARIAQMLAAAIAAASPLHLGMSGFYSMNPIDSALSASWSCCDCPTADTRAGGLRSAASSVSASRTS